MHIILSCVGQYFLLTVNQCYTSDRPWHIMKLSSPYTHHCHCHRSSHTYLLLSSAYFLVSRSYRSLGDILNSRDTTPDLCVQNRISSQVSSYFFCIQQSLLLCALEKCQSATTKTNVKIIVDVIKKLNPIQVHVHVNFISNVFSTP